MNSAESVEAFYALLEKRKLLSTSRSVNTPQWPAARNDHYCNQEVCRHAALDLFSLLEPSDSDSDVQSHVMLNNASFDSRDDTLPVKYSDTRSYHPNYSCFADEYAVGNTQFNRIDWSERPTHPRFGHTTPCTSHNDQNLQSSPISPKNLRSSNRTLRQELDNLQINSAESFLELDERLVTLAASYGTLHNGYDRLAGKHNDLLRIALKLCTELGVQAKLLTELKEWKMRTQKCFAEVQVQGQDPEVLYYGTPLSPPTVEIIAENLTPAIVPTGDQACTSAINKQDPSGAEMLSPSITPATILAEQIAHPRLKLRLPSHPHIEEELAKSSGALVSDQPASSKRVRKPAQKRKATDLQAKPTERKAKTRRT